jgi:hypothetical protein
MQTRELYHGTKGDNILDIIHYGELRPNAVGKIYFSEWSFASVLMHGADMDRKAAFAVKLFVTIPATASLQQGATLGIPDTLIVTTAIPLQVEVLELYVREARASTVKTVKGTPYITSYLLA